MLLVIANMLPIVGVLFLQWQVFPILLIFWLENIMVGLLNVPKIILARGGDEKEKRLTDRLFLLLFFCFHFGLFSYVHGAFVFSLFGENGGYGKNISLGRVMDSIMDLGLYWAVFALFISHGFSLVKNYVMAGEYKRVSAKDMMHQPYQRVIILHLTILAGGIMLQSIHEPVLGLLALVVVKTVIDLKAHIKERGKLSGRATPAEEFAKPD